ncbi:MAG: hypothetical protein H7231_04340 [Rhodoferax sp.]|nr:hypothetical protein [Actinomycetota bacterium]
MAVVAEVACGERVAAGRGRRKPGAVSALERDARRYNAMVVNGWIVIRLCYDDVMHHPDAVREVLAAAVASIATMARLTQ